MGRHLYTYNGVLIILGDNTEVGDQDSKLFYSL